MECSCNHVLPIFSRFSAMLRGLLLSFLHFAFFPVQCIQHAGCFFTGHLFAGIGFLLLLLILLLLLLLVIVLVFIILILILLLVLLLLLLLVVIILLLILI